MLTKLKIILAAIAFFALPSCIREDFSGCGTWLEFIFDYNMEYTDLFDPQVQTINVYLFDEAGKYVFTKQALSTDLHNRKRMFLSDNLPAGKYRILAVGGLSEHFMFTDMNGFDFIPGITSIEQAKLSMDFYGRVAHEFPHLWFATTTEICYLADLSVWPVYLIRETNKFRITLRHTAASGQSNLREPAHPYTVEIVAPETGAYNYRNNPIVWENRTYRPYEQVSGSDEPEPGILYQTVSKINTMRLLEDERNGYKLLVRDVETGYELMNFDLITLLEYSKPDNRPDGTRLPLQEYLDRRGEWEIVIVHNAFTALRVIINGWIVWKHNMEV